MLPRHPLLFKAATILILMCLAGVLFTNSKPTIIITRNFVFVTGTPPFFLGEQSNYSPTWEPTIATRVSSRPSTITTERAKPTQSVATTGKPGHYVRGEDLNVMINQRPCDNGTYVVIYVHSGPNNAERRRVIRSTWATRDILKQHGARLVFVMGRAGDEDTQASLENEEEVYHDIVQCNFTDTYRNLTYKAITGLKWVSLNCPKVTYVLKTDDDIVVDIHRVVRLMRLYLENHWGTRDVLGGYIWQQMDVNRDNNSKWYTSKEEYPDAFFRPYLSGSAYIMTPDVVQKFYHKSRELPFFWVDDYFVTGMLAHSTNTSLNSLNDRYVLENTANIKELLEKDDRTRLVFIHSPNTTTSVHAWKAFVGRWG